MIRHAACCLALAICTASAAAASATGEEVAADRETTVGMPAIIDELILPAPRLEAKPLASRDDPFILRVVNVYHHGSSFRYELEYYALEPGQYNVADYLQPVGGAAGGTLPPLTVTVKPLLPPGQILPHDPAPGAHPTLGGYRLWVALGAVLWVLAGYAIYAVGRKRSPESSDPASAAPLSLADRLRPAVEAAVAGDLSDKELAELERVLVAFWRDRLQLNAVSAAEAMRRLRAHPASAALLQQLERWLHHPGASSGVDVAALLEPYRALPADALPDAPNRPTRQEALPT